MDKPVFRMSTSGYCPKRLSAMLLGEPGTTPPSWLATSAEEGNWHEARIKQELRDLGCEVTDEQRELRLDYPKFTLLGHIDGVIRLSWVALHSPMFEVHIDSGAVPELPTLLEVKTFSFLEHQRWLKGMFEAFPNYKAQSDCYKYALGFDSMTYVVKDRSGGSRRLYVSKADFDLSLMINKLSIVVQYATEGELAPAEFDPMSIECRRCQFRAVLCSPGKLVVKDTQVIEAAADYLEGSTMKKLGTKLTDSAKEVLVGFALQNGVAQWIAGPYFVAYSHYLKESLSIKRLESILSREHFEEAINVSDIDRVRVICTTKED